MVLKNLGEVLKAAGSELGLVAKTTIFVKDLNDFDLVNRVYAEVFLLVQKDSIEREREG